MAAEEKDNKDKSILGWIDERFPLSSFVSEHLVKYGGCFL